jgi:type III pantothenate kinase
MILVDIGNSGLRATRVEDREQFEDQRVFRLSWSAAVASQRKPSPEQEAAPDQRWCLLGDVSAFDWLVSQFKSYPNEEWLISCVQQTALKELVHSLQRSGVRSNVRIVRYTDLSMEIDVEQPAQTGIDRLLSASAAYWLHQQSNPQDHQPIIIVQAGTAVTVDLVDENGAFRGGAIMPGLGLALQLLAAGTDQLPWLGNHVVDSTPKLPGKNTTQAISAGVNAALVGGVVHLIGRYREVCSDRMVYVSGGDGKLLLPHIEPPVLCVEHLVLRGLALVANRPVSVRHGQ